MPFLKTISDSNASDHELLAAYKRTGDLAVLGTLYARYMELVFGVCLKYLHHSEAAKDAVMQVFEELVQKLHQHEVDNFRNWLYTVARNYCLMQLRTPRNLNTVELDPDFMQTADELHLNGMLQKEEAFQALEICLKSLSPEQKQSVELFYLQHKCYQEIVDITGYEWNKVKSFIQNGRRNLKICMKEKNKL